MVIFQAPFAARAQDAVDWTCHRALTDQEIECLKQSQDLLGDVELESLQKATERINETDCPFIQALIMAAVARSLNRLIRQKLTYYLPVEVLEHPGFYSSLD